MFRRFDNFKVGALDAKRLNAMQDAIADLYRRIESTPRYDQQQYGITLARITARAGISQGECVPPSDAIRINCAIYYFEEVLVRVDGTGGQPGAVDTCVAVKRYDGMLRSSNVTWGPDEPGMVPILLDLDASGYVYDIGDIVPCFRARIDYGQPEGGLSKWRHLYVTRSANAAPVRKFIITEVRQQVGQYTAEEIPSPSGGATPEPIRNLYESEEYYGALEANVPCATLAPRRLRVGDVVPVFEHRFELLTMAPTAFDVTCLPCNGQPPATPAGAQEAVKAAAAAGIMLNGEVA